MKSTKLVAVMATALMVFALAATVEARPFGHRHRGFRMAGLKAFLELKLTDAQQAEMTAIINKYEPQKETFRNSIWEARKKMKAAFQADPFNETEARKAFQASAKIREEMFLLRIKMMTELKGVLTPEQQELLKKRRADRRKRFRHHFAAPPEKPNE